MFQSTVYRAYTNGFPGDWAKDGPRRAIPARINTASGASGVTAENAVGRVFGYMATSDVTDTNKSAVNQQVQVGGAVGSFAGILCDRNQYVLYGSGTVTGQGGSGTLAPSIILPDWAQGSFGQMGYLWVHVYNTEATAKTIAPGSLLYYVTNATTSVQAGTIPLGAMAVALAAGGAPTGFTQVPGCVVDLAFTLPATAGSVTVARIKLTN